MKPQPSLTALLACLLMAGCATPMDEVNALLRAGHPEQALELLSRHRERHPQDEQARIAQLRAERTLTTQLALQVELQRSAGQLAAARASLSRLRELDPRSPRLDSLEQSLSRAEAAAAAPTPLKSTPRPEPLPPPAPERLGPAFLKPVALEFRDAPLRTVLESLARSTGISFVFDKDVRTEAKVTVMLRETSVDEALRLLLLTQQLERKLLNDSTVLVYPATAAKHRDYQELVTRSFYLANADVKQVSGLVRTLAKAREVHVDERLNLMVVRDAPQVVALIEHLIASVDLPEPEVLMDVEVLEVASSRLDELGLKWPETVNVGLPAVDGVLQSTIPTSQLRGLRGWIANPAMVASLHGTSGNSSLLANPSIRARSREKARVQVGEKLPVFTTSTVANVQGLSTTVSYVDVGLKLDVEPTVQLDNDVSLRVGLEVTNLISKVSGPSGSIAYQVGTRNASTAIRLRDGETQILAGLIRNDDRRSADGLPGLSSLPLVGRLFGVQTDDVSKTEVVLLITPRVLRNVTPPPEARSRPAGTESQPGAPQQRLGERARVALANRSTGDAVASGVTPAASASTAEATVDVFVEAGADAPPGGTLALTVRHGSNATVRGELQVDASHLASDAADGRLAFELGPQGQRVFVLRVRPEAPIGPSPLAVNGLQATSAEGHALTVQIKGPTELRVRAAGAP